MSKETITDRFGNIIVDGLWEVLRAKEKTEEFFKKPKEEISDIQLPKPKMSRRRFLKIGAGAVSAVAVTGLGYFTVNEINKKRGYSILKEGDTFVIDTLTFYNHSSEYDIRIDPVNLKEITEKEKIPYPDFTVGIAFTDNQPINTPANQTILFYTGNVNTIVKQNPPDKDDRIRRAQIDISTFILATFIMYNNPEYSQRFTEKNPGNFPEDLYEERKKIYNSLVLKFLPKKRENPGSRFGYDILPPEYTSFVFMQQKNQ